MKTYYELYKCTAELHAHKLFSLTLDDIAGYAVDNDEWPELVERFEDLDSGLKALESCKNSAFIGMGYGSKKWIDVEEYVLIENLYDGDDFDHSEDQWPCENWTLDSSLNGGEDDD